MMPKSMVKNLLFIEKLELEIIKLILQKDNDLPI